MLLYLLQDAGNTRVYPSARSEVAYPTQASVFGIHLSSFKNILRLHTIFLYCNIHAALWVWFDSFLNILNHQRELCILFFVPSKSTEKRISYVLVQIFSFLLAIWANLPLWMCQVQSLSKHSSFKGYLMGRSFICYTRRIWWSFRSQILSFYLFSYICVDLEKFRY